MRRALLLVLLAMLATVCALIAFAPVPPEEPTFVPMTASEAVPYQGEP